MKSSILQHLHVPTSATTASSVWINDDVRPLPPARRTWGRLAYFSFQAINQICISNWQVGSSLVAIGLSVWQTMISVILAKCIIALVCVYNGYVGSEWHIGYPVLCRVIWGVYGSYFAIFQRIFLSIIWYAVQSWFGGLCITAILSAIFPQFMYLSNTMPASTFMTTSQFLGWIVYNIISMPMLWVPPEKTQRIFAVMNSIAFVTMLSIMIWALSTAHGGGPLLSQPATVSAGSDLGWAIVKGVTSVIGSIAVGLTNAPDWSRFATRPGDQVIGQWTAIIGFGCIMPLFGCLTSSATQKIYGEIIWNPPIIVLKWMETDYNAKTRAAGFFAGFGLVVSQLAINTVDNGFSLGMDLSGLFPKYINIRRGAYTGFFLSMATCPWWLLSSAATFVNVLSAYSIFLGPMLGIQICDYWIIRSRRLKLSDLYHPGKEGVYYYSRGVNWRAYAAWIIGFTPQLPGFISTINPAIKTSAGAVNLYDLAFIVGFLVSFLLYWVFCTISPPKGAGEIDETDVYGTFTIEEALRRGMGEYDQAVEVEIDVDEQKKS